MKKTIKLFSFLASIALSGVFAPALADTATPAPTPAAPTVTVNGLVDAYYTYNFTNGSNSALNTGNVGYWYNSMDNSFTLGLAEAKFTATQGPASAHLVLAYGEEGSLLLLGPGLDVLQAYLSYNAGQWTFNAGRFVTWMGYEVIESNANMNYSHSLLFGALPYWHTGLSVNFAPDSTFNMTGYVVDGWNTTAASVEGKDYGLELSYAPSSQWSFIFNGIIGPDAFWGYNDLTNFDGELIASFKPDSMWSFALDAEYGMTSLPSGVTGVAGPSFLGIALYGRDQIASDWAIALRLEDLMDSAELGGGYYDTADHITPTSSYEGTLTLEHNFSTNMLVRLEGRYDTNSSPTYTGTDTAAASIYAGGASTSQFTTTLSAMMSY